MASTFSFGFSGDDIDMDVDDIEVDAGNNGTERPDTEDKIAPNSMFPAVRHALKDWVSLLYVIYTDMYI